MPTPVRFPGGVTNAAPFQTLADAGFLDPSYYHVYFNDFDTLNSGDFVASDVGLATAALTAVDGGNLLLTTTAGATDSTYLQLGAASFAFTPATSSVAGKKSFFKIRFKLGDATNSAFYAGLAVTGTTNRSGATDGLMFYKNTGAATFVLRNIATSTTTDTAIPASVHTLANNTYVELGWYFNGKTTVKAFVNPSTGYFPGSGHAADTNPVNLGAVAQFDTGTTALSTSTLNLSFGLLNGASAAKTATIDYILMARER